MAAKKSKEVVVKEENAVAPLLDMFAEDANAGLEDIGAEDMAIPFLKILSQLSPEIQKRDGKYIDGAEAGMILNNVSGEVFEGEEGILVVPVAYKREYIEWRPKDQGGGIVAFHDSNSEAVRSAVKGDKGRDVMPNGNELQNTAQHYVLLLKEDGGYEQAVISMKSTQLKKSRRWNSMMMALKMKRPDGSMFTPACYSHAYHLTTVPESNDQGAWNGWKISNSGPLRDPDVYAAAKQFFDAVQAGETKVKHEEEPADQVVAEVVTPF
ncbi:MAG: hypothetical protein P8N94_15645 [Gammaproteobacteria bacterium]|nr:hypothetical protein [Gammaproteobacteria bacterium]